MIAAELSRRIAKARQSEVFLRDLSFDRYLDVLDTLSESNARTFDVLPIDIQKLILQAESNALTASTAFHLPGKHDQSEHGRDRPNAPKDAAKPKTSKAKKLKVTHGLVHKKHEPGTIIAVSGSDDKRAVWDGNKYLLQEKQADGGWVTKSTAIKSKAYVEIGQFDDDWREPDSDATAPDIEVNTPKPAAAAKPAAGAKKTGAPGSPLKITHGLVHSKYEPGEIIAENGDDTKRVVWDGDKYRLQVKNANGKYTTEKTAIKSKAYAEINAYDSDWRVPKAADSDNDDANAAPAPAPAPAPTPAPASSTPKPGSKIKITSSLVGKDYPPGTVIAVNWDNNKRAVWDGDKYLLQAKASDGSWLTVQNATKTDAHIKIKEFDDDWNSPKEGEETVGVAVTSPTPAPATKTGAPLKSMDDLTFVVKTSKLSVFKDKNGVQWNVRPAQSESHARNHFLAANLYNFAGVSVEMTDLVEIDPNKLPDTKATIAVKTTHTPTTASIVPTMSSSAQAKKQVNENFAIDAWLGNWDVVGLGYENLSVSKYGDVKRTNIGGSLLYRANGTPKGNAFGDTVTEIDSLRNPTINPSSAKVFADVTDDDIRAGVAKLEALSPATIDFVVEQSGFTGAEAEKLKKTLKARRQDLINKYGSNAPKPATPANAPASSTQPTATNALGGGVKVYTGSQKAKVQGIFAKNDLKWHSKTDKLYDAALEVSKTHPDLTMGDALDIMDKSLKKKTGNPFRTKVEKWLKTPAGKKHAIAQGGSASIGSTSSTVQPAPAVPPLMQPKPGTSSSGGGKLVDHGGPLPKKLTRTSANLLQQRMDEAFPPPWTPAQRQALKTYTGGSYTTINKCARGTAPCDPKTKKLIEDIKGGMKPSTDDITVFRKTGPAAFGLTSAADMKDLVGKVINDDGVISTSIKDGLWSGQLHLEIEAPKGSMLAWVQPISLHPGEDEIVVAPGTHYEVVSVEKHPYYDSYIVKLRIIPGSDTRSREIAAEQKKKKEDEDKEEEQKAKKSKLAQQKIDALRDAYAEGYVVEKEFTAGNSSSKTELLRLANGTRVVRKSGGKQLLSKKPDTRFEYLGGRVWNALGGTDTYTAQVADDTVITTFVEGDMGGKLLNNTYKSGNTNQENKKAYKAETLRQIQLPGGKEIGLLDFLIANQDRHSLNWIVSPDNDQVHPIDQGGAVFIPSLTKDEDGNARSMYVASEFTDYWLGVKGSWYVKSMKPKFTKAELAQHRANLEAIKDEFKPGEETEWYNSMMSRLAEVESKVKS